MLGNDFHSMKSNFFADIVIMLNTKHLFLKQILANMLSCENNTFNNDKFTSWAQSFVLFLVSFAEVCIEVKNKLKPVSSQ